MKFQLVFLCLGISASALAAEKPLSVPSDSKAQFFVLEKGGSGAQRFIVTKRVGSSGISYSKRLYDCTDSTVKYLVLDRKPHSPNGGDAVFRDEDFQKIVV